MNRLWAPWRKVYIRPEGKRGKKCPFCRINKAGNDKSHYILKRTPSAYAVLNLYPYNNGHVLIIPNRHVSCLSDLTDAEKLEVFDLSEQVIGAYRKALNSEGVNLGMNLGKAAGAGLPEHLHLHLVPRWLGDSNFMPIIGGTKVISESMESVYKVLHRALLKGNDC